MDNFSTVFRFELKKLTKRKLLWVSLLICMIFIAVTATSSLFGTYYVEGEPVETHYEIFQKDKAYRKALSGRAINQELLEETMDAYKSIPLDAQRYTLTEEYQSIARPYSDIFNLISLWTGMELPELREWEVSEEALYAARTEFIEKYWQSIPLNEGEKEFWREKERQLELPLTYYYHEGYEMALTSFLSVGVLMLLFVAVCLSNVFPSEHTRRTDQLTLSSAKGKSSAYWAKLLAGVTVSVTASTLMALATIFLCLVIYGAEGFECAIQIFFYDYSYPISMGEACLIAYGILVITSVLAAVFVMVLSELLRSGVATLAVSSGLVILGGLVSIPTQYRAVAQIWDWSPMAYLSTWNIFDSRMLTLFGHCFASWQVVPVIYILLSVALIFLGKFVYGRYQVSGR